MSAAEQPHNEKWETGIYLVREPNKRYCCVVEICGVGLLSNVYIQNARGDWDVGHWTYHTVCEYLNQADVCGWTMQKMPRNLTILHVVR